MGKAARWFRNIWGGGGKKEQPAAAAASGGGGKRWSFGKSSRDSAEAAAAAAVVAESGGNAAIARAAEAAWLRSVYATADDKEREQSKHAIAVAAATAAAADAAVAAAHAAVAVVRLTSKGRVTTAPVLATGNLAAIKIQTAFRGYLAKKALRALKALVKLQALVRGYLVRRQAAATLQSMEALVRAQATVRACRSAARPRRSLQKRCVVDETRSEAAAAAAASFRRRLSASIESSSSSLYGFDRSPKIVEVDTCARPKTSSSRRASSPSPLLLDAAFAAAGGGGEDSSWCANSMSSPLPPPPARIAVPAPRHHFPTAGDAYDWYYSAPPPEKPRPATAQSTPRFAPPTPTKSVSGAGGNCPGYMSNTRSFEAKVRSHSAPKQRPETIVVSGAGAGGGGRKRVPLSEVLVVESRASLSGLGMQRSCNRVQEAFNFKTAVVGRLDHHRSSEIAAGENDRHAFLQRRW
uniref:DUF4005 domain-containing protein n=1 Tax=Leersia perrieri TaxID=77586 RepID=A0A0D9WDK3_9ORYZ